MCNKSWYKTFGDKYYLHTMLTGTLSLFLRNKITHLLKTVEKLIKKEREIIKNTFLGKQFYLNKVNIKN